MLIDSNIIIYAARPGNTFLREFIEEHTPAVSAVSYVEVLGYHLLGEPERSHLIAFFTAASILPLSWDVLERAAQLRQQKKLTLGDALVAATCLVHGLTLVTRNTRGFAWIAGLSLLNPFATGVASV